MKLKQGSLLDKINQENLSNSASTEVLNEVRPLISKLKPNTILINKIGEINQLQSQNKLDSSNKIFEIVTSNFEYKYPFCFMTNGIDTLEKTTLILEDNLINHIKKEVELNKFEPEFNSIYSSIKEKKKLNSKGLPMESWITSIFLGVLGVFLAYKFNTSMWNMRVGHAGHSFLKLIGIIVSYVSYLAFPVLGYLAGLFLFNYNNKIKNLDEKIKRELTRLKTKANNV